MTNQNTNHATVKGSYVINTSKSEVKVVVTNKKAPAKELKTVAGFAKNTRYSIYNNGGGYTGL